MKYNWHHNKQKTIKLHLIVKASIKESQFPGAQWNMVCMNIRLLQLNNEQVNTGQDNSLKQCIRIHEYHKQGWWEGSLCFSYCGFWPTRTLPYFPLSACSFVCSFITGVTSQLFSIFWQFWPWNHIMVLGGRGSAYGFYACTYYKKLRFGQVSLMPDTQTTDYRATQLKFKVWAK